MYKKTCYYDLLKAFFLNIEQEENIMETISCNALNQTETRLHEYIVHMDSFLKDLKSDTVPEFEIRIGHIRNHQGKQTFDSFISEKCFSHIKAIFDNTSSFNKMEYSINTEYYIGKNRYTLDNNGIVTDCIQKENQKNSEHSLMPDNSFDIRMSLNTEIRIQSQKIKPKDVIKKAQYSRHKERWSYYLDLVKYDLSVITMQDIPNPQYEIEIELLDPISTLSIYQFKHIAKDVTYKVCDVLSILNQKS